MNTSKGGSTESYGYLSWRLPELVPSVLHLFLFLWEGRNEEHLSLPTKLASTPEIVFANSKEMDFWSICSESYTTVKQPGSLYSYGDTRICQKLAHELLDVNNKVSGKVYHWVEDIVFHWYEVLAEFTEDIGNFHNGDNSRRWLVTSSIPEVKSKWKCRWKFS